MLFNNYFSPVSPVWQKNAESIREEEEEEAPVRK